MSIQKVDHWLGVLPPMHPVRGGVVLARTVESVSHHRPALIDTRSTDTGMEWLLLFSDGMEARITSQDDFRYDLDSELGFAHVLSCVARLQEGRAALSKHADHLPEFTCCKRRRRWNGVLTLWAIEGPLEADRLALARAAKEVL
jgi:hypothetical protein